MGFQICRCNLLTLGKWAKLSQELPGIGVKRGYSLLKQFSTFENIVNASADDLVKVEGIGHKLADRICTILHEPF